jgi:Ca-activated chloride channel family protein
VTLAALLAAATLAAPVVGGGSYNDAPLLEPGRFRDTILPGERLFYGFELKAGQRLRVAARLEGRLDDFRDVAAGFSAGIETPLREVEVLELVDEDVAGNTTLVNDPGDRIEFVSVPALTASAAREEELTYRGPGTWFVSLFLSTTDDEPARVEFPVELEVERIGSPQPDPRPDPGPRRTAPRAAAEDDGGTSTAAVVGAGAAGLLAGLLGGGLAARRRGR